MRNLKSSNSFFSSLIKNYLIFTLVMSISLISIVLIGYIAIVGIVKNYVNISSEILTVESVITEEYIIIAPALANIILIVGLVLFLVVYVAILIIFSKVLTSKVRVPLDKLNKGLQSIAMEKDVHSIEFNGDKEFVQICDSFNMMINRLQKSQEENKKLQEEKKKMIADISHDLKTPITSIQGYSKVLYDNMVSEDEKEHYLKLIYNKSEELSELINFFHEYSVLERHDYKMKTEKIDINEYMRKFLAKKYDQIYEEGFNIDVNIKENKLFVNIDLFQFKRALNNLINNSLKYNKENTTIGIYILEVDESCIIEIKDNGIGIPKGLKNSIFEPFVTGDESRGSNKHGTGLGLAITKLIIEKHNGNITLNKNLDDGWSTVFKIELPKS